MTWNVRCLMTGIGGQGVQLCAQVLARGAVHEGSHVMLFGVYAGAMRGMNTDATLVVGDGPLQSPPLLSHTGSAIGMHDKFFGRRSRASCATARSSSSTTPRSRPPLDARPLPRGPGAGHRPSPTELGNPLGGSMVMAGAYAGDQRDRRASTRCVEGMRESIPSYRTAAHRRRTRSRMPATRAERRWELATPTLRAER